MICIIRKENKMEFVEDITGRFLININIIELIDHTPDGKWYVMVGSRDFEVSDETVERLKKDGKVLQPDDVVAQYGWEGK